MASTYSTNLRLELITTGEQQGTWGATTNKNLGTLLEQAICGYESVTVTNGADTVLTATDGLADQSRNMILNLTGTLTAARNVICPAIEKLYVVRNATSGGFAVTFKVSGQTGVTIPNGSTVFLYVDGTDARSITGSIATQSANSVSITGGTISGITDLAVTDGGTGASDPATARTNLGLTIGTNVQAYDATLQSISALGTAADKYAYTTGVDTWAEGTITAAGRAILDDADAAAQRTTLGLGSLATLNTVGTAQIDDNSVNGAKIALGSDAQGDIMYYNGTDWVRLPAGTAGQILRTGGSGANPSWANSVTQGTAVNLAALTSTTFSSLPAGINNITISFSNVALLSDPNMYVQLGTSSGIVASGYVSSSKTILSDSGGGGNITGNDSVQGFTIRSWSTGYSNNGTLSLYRVSSNTWVSSHTLMCISGGNYMSIVGGGTVSLASELTQIRVISIYGSFNSGLVNIQYW